MCDLLCAQSILPEWRLNLSAGRAFVRSLRSSCLLSMQVEGLAELVPHVSVCIMKDCSLTKDGTIDEYGEADKQRRLCAALRKLRSDCTIRAAA
jgi:hypothetical protein